MSGSTSSGHMGTWPGGGPAGPSDPISQQTEQSPRPENDMWIAQVPTTDGWDYIVFGGRTYDATYKTMAEAQARIDYIKAGGDGW